MAKQQCLICGKNFISPQASNYYSGLCYSCYLNIRFPPQPKPPTQQQTKYYGNQKLQYSQMFHTNYGGRFPRDDFSPIIDLKDQGDLKFEHDFLIKTSRVWFKINIDTLDDVKLCIDIVPWELLEDKDMSYGSVQIVWEPIAGVYKLTSEINWKNDLQKGLPVFMKALIPASDRSYQPITRTWFFSEYYYDKVRQYCELAFSTSYFFTKEQSVEYEKQFHNAEQGFIQPVVDVNKYKTIINSILSKCGLTNNLDFENWDMAVKIYRKACLLLHPDRNPAGAEDMSKLNEAWSYVKAEKEAKQVV